MNPARFKHGYDFILFPDVLNVVVDYYKVEGVGKGPNS